MKRFVFVLFLFIKGTCCAQVIDNFSDGDFTNNPGWSGDVAKFTVNTGFQLQLNSTGADSNYLAVPNTGSLDNYEWNFWIRLNFSPSSSNKARVYLVSDQQNLKSPLNGYYLQFGEALSNDQVELFRQSGSVSTSVCRGTTLIASAFAIRVKVIRDASALWQLFIDPAGGNLFQLEATGTDTSFNTTSYFGMVCKYTSSNATKFYFDDFYIGPMIPDTIPPALTTISVTSSTQLDVHFNEQVDSSTAQNINNYSVNNGTGIPALAQRDLSDFTIVHLTFGAPFQSSLLYTLTANNISDLSGNILPANSTADFVIPEAAQSNDVIINEILYNPLAGGEDFVELYNRSAKIIDLNTLNIASGDYGTQVLNDINVITTENLFLLPGEYAILTESPDAVRAQYYSPSQSTFVQVASMPAYNIDNDIVAIVDAASHVVIDRLLYSNTWQFPLLNDAKGVSLERINPGKPAQDSTNWHSAAESAGFATPGYRNSQYSETSSDGSEISITPEIFSPDNDGYNDVANINYHFDAAGYTANVTIFDSRGRHVRKLTTSELLGTNGSFTWDGVNDKHEKAGIGIYIVFVEIFRLDGTVKSFKKTCVLASRL
jgi:hypothetical protein